MFASGQVRVSRRSGAGRKGLGLFEMTALEARLLLHAEQGLDEAVLHLDEPAAFMRLTEGTESAAIQAAVAASYPLSSVPRLNSNPGAKAQLFLDFDGDIATRWGVYRVTATPAFDRDGDETTFSDGEVTSMREIWARVAEKYSPFNVNVTTVDPGSYLDKAALRVVIGGDGLWSGGSYGGLAYVGSFTNFSPNTVYVFPDNLGRGTPKYVAEAAAHEAGHGFGLEHQSSYDANGRLVDEYSEGTGTIAPVMGVSYYSRGVWWNGPTTSATTMQNDMALLAGTENGFGYRADDHGNAPGSATALLVDGVDVTGSGIIGKSTDADYFKFSTGAGTISLTANVAKYGAMLDLKLVLKNSAGTTIATADTANLGETLTAAVAAGTYSLGVLSEGNYGDVGQYSVSGTIVAAGASLVAPTGLTASVDANAQVVLRWTDQAAGEEGFTVQRSLDGGLTWVDLGSVGANATTFSDATLLAGVTAWYRVSAFNGAEESDYSAVATATMTPPAPAGLVASGIAPDRIRLTWKSARGATAYLIERSSDGVAWQVVKNLGAAARTWINTGLDAETTYSYRVIASNSGGESMPGNVASATTLPLSALPAAPSDLSVARVAKYRLRLNWTDNSDNETGFAIQWSGNGKVWHTVGRVPADLTSVDVVIYRARTNYFRIFAYNEIGGSNASEAAAGVTGTRIARTGTFASRPIRVGKGKVVSEIEGGEGKVF